MSVSLVSLWVISMVKRIVRCRAAELKELVSLHAEQRMAEHADGPEEVPLSLDEVAIIQGRLAFFLSRQCLHFMQKHACRKRQVH